eukprot:4013840-Lingulodinium_polyedra.AAC.1
MRNTPARARAAPLHNLCNDTPGANAPRRTHAAAPRVLAARSPHARGARRPNARNALTPRRRP